MPNLPPSFDPNADLLPDLARHIVRLNKATRALEKMEGKPAYPEKAKAHEAYYEQVLQDGGSDTASFVAQALLGAGIDLLRAHEEITASV